MGTAQRKPHPALVEDLLRSPGSFTFFRAVQVLEETLGRKRGRKGRKRVGGDHSSSEVGIRFDVVPSLAFPDRQITAVEEGSVDPDAPDFEVRVSFLGLVGPAGTLPTHYTEILLKRLQEKDAALRDYLRVFQDRGIALFYRAWKKYRLAVSYLDADLERGDPDPVLNSILGLVGLLPHAKGSELRPLQLVQAHHAGLYSNRRRSANGLRAMLAGLLGCQVRVQQFVGQWIELDPAACSRLGAGRGPGTQATLGEETVLGSRVWSVDARIRVVAGPLSRARFRQLWPGGEPVRYLWGAIRSYLGPLIECDLVWELAPDAPAATILGGDQRLGRDCWLGWSDFGGPDRRVGSPPWHNPPPVESHRAQSLAEGARSDGVVRGRAPAHPKLDR